MTDKDYVGIKYLVALFILVGLFRFFENINPLIGWGTAILLMSFRLYRKYSFRRNINPSEFRLPMQNDIFLKSSLITIGSLLFVGLVIWIIVRNELNLVPIAGLIIGGLLVANGILELPSGILKIQNSMLIWNETEEIVLKDIKSIKIGRKRITFFDINNQQIKLEVLELDGEWMSHTLDFLTQNVTDYQIGIKCEDIN
ncbi:MAG: hypothetical protein ACI8ZN_001118 [Bacteroidia bacterium]|jgi:hypothetical protein